MSSTSRNAAPDAMGMGRIGQFRNGTTTPPLSTHLPSPVQLAPSGHDRVSGVSSPVVGSGTVSGPLDQQ